jgi:hypothetical protein
MPQGETAVEQAIYSLGGSLFARILNPLIILGVAFAIAFFLFLIFRTFYQKYSTGKVEVTSLLRPVLGLTIILSAIGITYFIGNTGNEIFQAPAGGGAVKGIDQVVKPIKI